MSEEEIIEIIEKLQCEYKEQQNDKKYNDYTVFKANEYSKGLQGLLDLYNNTKKSELILANKFQKVNIELNKEKEKNKKIEDKIKMETNRLKEHGYWEFLEQRDLDKTISIIQNLLEE